MLCYAMLDPSTGLLSSGSICETEELMFELDGVQIQVQHEFKAFISDDVRALGSHFIRCLVCFVCVVIVKYGK